MKQQTLTKGEMQVMNVLWDLEKGACVNDILEHYPEPKPAYTTIATFLLIYTPLITKEKYRRQVMEEVKDDFFGNSFKSMFSFFVKEEHISADDIKELLKLMEEDAL